MKRPPGGLVSREGRYYVAIPRLGIACAQVEKAASMSIWRAFSRATHPQAKAKTYPQLVQHSVVLAAQSAGDLDGYHVLVPVRNPWDRVHSLWWQKLVLNRKRRHSPYFPELDTRMPLRAFVRHILQERPGGADADPHWRAERHWMFLGGHRVVNQVLFFDHLERTWAGLWVCFPGLGPLPRTHVKRRRPYRRDYDKKTARIVARYYAWEIRALKWRF